MEDTYNLQRFTLKHQQTYQQALSELQSGYKRSHWMWWIFPQITGLGLTATSREYGIKSLAEARVFLVNPSIA